MLDSRALLVERAAEARELALTACEACGRRRDGFRERVQPFSEVVDFLLHAGDALVCRPRWTLCRELGNGAAKLLDGGCVGARPEVSKGALESRPLLLELPAQNRDLTVRAGVRRGSRVHRRGERREPVGENIDAIRETLLELRIPLRPGLERAPELLERLLVPGDRARAHLGVELLDPGCERLDTLAEEVLDDLVDRRAVARFAT